MSFTKSFNLLKDHNYSPTRKIYLELEKAGLVNQVCEFIELNIKRLESNDFTEEVFLKHSDCLTSKVNHFINRLVINKDFINLTGPLRLKANELILIAFTKSINNK